MPWRGILAQIFGRTFTDILSGYRIFSRRFVKSFPILSTGFEIETEMSVHALELRMPVGEISAKSAAWERTEVTRWTTVGAGGGCQGDSSAGDLCSRRQRVRGGRARVGARMPFSLSTQFTFEQGVGKRSFAKVAKSHPGAGSCR